MKAQGNTSLPLSLCLDSNAKCLFAHGKNTYDFKGSNIKIAPLKKKNVRIFLITFSTGK